MTDVFVSYASEDRELAGKLSSALGAQGWSVWWDRNIIAGQAFDHAIERELETAKSVVVLWSKHSIASEWVKSEAAVAAERGVLVPAIIESVKPPLEFRRKQTADLTGWSGEPSHSGFRALCEGVTHTIGSVLTHRSTPAHGQSLRWNPRRVLAAIAAIAVAVALGFYLTNPWRTTAPTEVSQSDRSGAGTPSESKKLLGAGLADLVVGTYFGHVTADSKGGSRSDIVLTITRLDRSTVRLTSDYQRLGTVDIELTRVGNKIFQASGDTPFIVDLDLNPPALLVTPRNELTYSGARQQ